MDSSDSRKRPLDGDSDSGVTKRSNPGSVGSDYESTTNTETPTPGHVNETVQLKVLIPSIAAGAIIGKGGETITQIQKDTGASVKMSKNNDFYPGTSERVCLVSGTPESVRNVSSFIMDKIREKPDPNPKPHDGEGKVNFERHKQMKILVPNSTAGMVIGKGGAFIRQIKDESGAYVQVSQKSKDMSLTERCVTIAGDSEQNTAAMDMILQKVIEDPQSGSCPNISYADVKGPIASSNPTGSPFANGRDGFGNPVGPNPNVFGNIGSSMNNLNLNSGAGANMQQQQQQQHQQHQQQHPQAQYQRGGVSNPSLENLKSTLRGSGYSEQATEEISSALFTLANYGFLGLGLGLAGLGIGLGVQGIQQQGGQQHPQGGPPGNLTLANLAGILGGGSGPGHGPGPGAAANHTNMNPNASGSLLNNNTTQPPPPPTNGSGDGNPSVFGPVGSTTTNMSGVEASQAGSSYFVGANDHMGSNNYSGGESMFGGNQYSGNNTAFGSSSSSGGGDAGFSGTNQNSFGLGTGMSFSNTSPPGESSMVEGVEDGEGDGSGISKKELQVGEHIVGAILGPGGRGIVDLQKSTSTNIQISKKGVYAPGTRNRIVTVTGASGAVQHAQYLIQQRIIEEESKRARQNQVQPTGVRPRPAQAANSSL